MHLQAFCAFSIMVWPSKNGLTYRYNSVSENWKAYKRFFEVHKSAQPFVTGAGGLGSDNICLVLDAFNYLH